VAAAYCHRGWAIRKWAWIDTEVSSDWAVLWLGGVGEIGIFGCVSDALTHIDDILSPLRDSGLEHWGTCVSSDGKLLLEFNWRCAEQDAAEDRPRD
jgi:hypothetical protein